jgi:hypothetical protein
MHLHVKFFDNNDIYSDVWRNNTKDRAGVCIHGNAFDCYDVASNVYSTKELILLTTFSNRVLRKEGRC